MILTGVRRRRHFWGTRCTHSHSPQTRVAQCVWSASDYPIGYVCYLSGASRWEHTAKEWLLTWVAEQTCTQVVELGRDDGITLSANRVHSL
jgi:hypothetical protein